MKEDLTASDKAVLHIVRLASDDQRVGYYLGFGSRSFDLLVTAYAGICNTSREGAEKHLRDRIRGERPSCTYCDHCNPSKCEEWSETHAAVCSRPKGHGGPHREGDGIEWEGVEP